MRPPNRLFAGIHSLTAFAQNTIAAPSRPFAGTDNTDLAQAWLQYLFHGDALPEQLSSYAAPLSFATDGLREAMGLYSMGMLIIAALLVFYHLAAMVVETAHSGIPFGRRANQVWMPIRFVFAIGLLIPVSSSLNAGQYLVVRIAKEGSTLASNAWRMVASEANGHLAGLVTPRGPDIAHLAATSIEINICRAVYAQLYAAQNNDTIIHAAGDISGIAKLPADRFMSETWRATNILNSNAPMCGEYRFSGYRRSFFEAPALRPEAVSRMAEHLSNFAHTQADDLETQARSIGDRIGTVFLSPAAPIGADVHADIATLESTYANRLDAEQQQISFMGAGLAEQTLTDSVAGGWLAAASFIPDFVRLQESYSELMSHALPTAQSPVFAHPHLARQMLNDAIATAPIFIPLEGAAPEKLVTFYGQVSRIASQVHTWLYATQLSDKDFIAPASADLHEMLNATTEPEAAASYFAQAMDAAAFTYGVWGEDPDHVDTGYPFAAVPAAVSYNPFAALVEFGRRQIDLSTELAGLAGSGLSVSGATGPSILLGLASFCFLIGGITLIFIAPLLPFLRFLIAALAWGLNVFEAAIAIPIVAIAHLTPVGSGLSGSLARQAYMLWLGLLVRPILTLFGFVFGLVLFTLSIAFIDAVLTPFARLSIPSNSGLLTGANTGLVILYDVLVYAAANASFRGVSWLPDNALRWTSSFVITDPGETNTAPVINPGSPTGLTAIANFISSSISGNNGSAAGKTGSGSASAASSQSHAMKMALMPAYADKASAPDIAKGATTGLASSTHFTDHSMGSTGGTNVNVSTHVTTSGSGSSGLNRDAKPDKNRFKGGEHEADMGNKERGAAKDGSSDSAQSGAPDISKE